MDRHVLGASDAYSATVTEQRDTFDQVATLYDDVRPRISADAVQALWDRLALSRGDAVLEVGSGTGQLTEHLASRGAQVTAIEPGPSLAQICAERMTGHDVTVVETSFEEWSPGARRYRAVTACQAAHWIEPATFLDHSSESLEPGGGLGLLWYVDRSEGTSFWQSTEPLYDRYLPNAPNQPPRTIPLHIAAYEQTLEQDPRFEPRPIERWTWSRTFDEATYLRLLETMSPVRMLSAADRAAFLAGHAQLIRTQGGQVERRYETMLLVAHGQSPWARPRICSAPGGTPRSVRSPQGRPGRRACGRRGARRLL